MKFFSIISGLFLLASILLGVFLWSAWYHGSPGEIVPFEVQKGDNFVVLSRRLESAGIIHNERAYRWYVNFFATGQVLKRGEYELHKGMSISEVVAKLMSGRVMAHHFTIPEGNNLFQIADRLQASGLGQAEAFIAAARDPSVFGKLIHLGEAASEIRTAEGFLFPDTYDIPKGTSESEILQKFVERFNEKFKSLNLSEMPEHLKALGITQQGLITLASLVEKETGAAKERPIIASIFLNRLKKKMRLQCDPTTIYGIWQERGVFDGNLRKADLQRNDAYNTYVISGIPAGPIANPGLEAIRAVLEPASTEYLYFVSRNDGTHEFAVDYKVHQKNVDLLQKRAIAREGKSWRDLPASERANSASKQ